MYKITLQDGTTIDNLELNGNNLISSTTIDKTIFENNLDKVSIIDTEGNIERLKDCKVIFAKVSGKQSFIISEKTKEELEKEYFNQLLADLTETVLMGGMQYD